MAIFTVCLRFPGLILAMARYAPHAKSAKKSGFGGPSKREDNILNELGSAISDPIPHPSVIGPDGKLMTLADLPPANTKRWVVRRKAVVVFAVRAGLLTLEAACDHYGLSVEEFMSWQRLIENHGMRGLRTTRLQQYRNSHLRRRG